MSVTPETLREAAYKRIKERRDFWPHLVMYVTINTVLVLVWALATPSAIFGPAFPRAGGGIGIVMHAWSVFVAQPITEADIDRELARMTAHSRDSHFA